MNFLQQPRIGFGEKSKPVNVIAWLDSFKRKGSFDWKERTVVAVTQEITDTRKQLEEMHGSIKLIGASQSMDDYEKRKLSIFNQLNFFQLLSGIIIPVAGLFHNKNFSQWSWLVACMPALISVIVLILNAGQKHEAGIIFYFISYPVATSMVYMSGIHMGTELFFILYGILSVFFLQEITTMLFSVSFNMISYFMLAVVWSDHRFQLESANMFLYLFNQFTGIAFIFFGLFLIKKENIGYQSSILAKNKEIAENAVLLEQQTLELTELNSVKNKLFSVIAHDLRTPMYSLRNLFRSIQEQDIPPRKIRAIMPDVINNLNYTTGLMENLLQWAKSQMHSQGVNIQALDITRIVSDTIVLLQLPAVAKQQVIQSDTSNPCTVMGDKDMIELVLRNLLSNAIKFTPPSRIIEVGYRNTVNAIEIFVNDTGRGMDAETIRKIDSNNYFSTNGTAQEPGTGLGLMLCKEFLLKNNSRLLIDSEPGKGSTFSFLLPQHDA
ncbi:MAG: ATP-binding protein [Bacteroidota bacterium]